MNLFLLLCDVFLFVFWKKLKTPKIHLINCSKRFKNVPRHCVSKSWRRKIKVPKLPLWLAIVTTAKSAFEDSRIIPPPTTIPFTIHYQSALPLWNRSHTHWCQKGSVIMITASWANTANLSRNRQEKSGFWNKLSFSKCFSCQEYIIYNIRKRL